MKKKILRIVLRIVLTVFVYIVLLWIALTKYDYHIYERNFKANPKQEPYSLGIPLDEMDFHVYYNYFNHIFTATDPCFTKTIVLPCDVEYYNSKDDVDPILTLKKGTEVYVVPEDDYHLAQNIGYGIICWPDYDKEWRYGYPFLTEETPFISKESTMYYVKLKPLMKVAESFYEHNQRQLGDYTDASQFSLYITRYIDKDLYDKGVFCSPSGNVFK